MMLVLFDHSDHVMGVSAIAFDSMMPEVPERLAVWAALNVFDMGPLYRCMPPSSSSLPSSRIRSSKAL